MLGFLLIFASLISLLYGMEIQNESLLAVAGVLFIFALTDYVAMVIPVKLAQAGFFGVIALYFSYLGYAYLVFPLFIIFGTATLFNRERIAYWAFLASVPLAFVNSYLEPHASVPIWTLIGLMLGFTEHAIVEEMAEGDIYIISLYFALLGPFAFIPYAAQNVVGSLLYYRKEAGGWPVGPAMFVTAAPVFALITKAKLPEFLIYAYNHSPPNPNLATYVTFAIFFLSVIVSEAFILVLLVSFGLAAYTGMLAYFIWGEKAGETVTLVVLLGSLVILKVKGKLHIQNASSVSPEELFWGSSAIAVIMTAFLLFSAVKAFSIHEVISGIITGTLLATVGYWKVKKAEMWGWWFTPRYFLINGAVTGFWIGVALYKAYFFVSLYF
ncbi:hypothetical protein [Thermococcus barophilus]|uniref:Uncharacterized protein n=1 Tax=Thermococcus barophilus TaxID=55802 RepID=A0A0S1XER9_THEBA|nr:hypothetical protein [Thermococcus barophilus]ALM76257.1 conserved membrane hypothetical protein [Thermococcus barophilus]